MVDNTIVSLVLQSAGIVAGSWLVAELLIRVVSAVAKRAGVVSSVSRSIREVVTIVWIVFAVQGVARITGFSSDFATLTVSGVVGLAISLGLQATLSNIIAGLLLFHDGTLRLNDIVEYGAVKGRVVKVALRSTWIRNDQDNIVIISNSTLSNGPLTNYTALERLSRKL